MPKRAVRHRRRPSGQKANSIPAAAAPRVPRHDDDVANRLARLLDTPQLARIVPRLPPEALHQVIRHQGLDACGELIAAATPEQLTSVFDLDLWRNPQAGRDENFDEERFGEWLEVLVDAGESVAARTVAAIDATLVIAGLSRYLRVFDPASFEPTFSSDDEPMDAAAMMRAGTVTCEIGGYLVCAKRADAWDAIMTLLATLDANHPSCFHAVMTGCRRLSNSTPEIDGLDDLLRDPEQLLHDVALDRERRRSQQGYLTPADARAFLQMARQPRDRRAAASSPMNPLATAYFRAGDDAAASAGQDASSPKMAAESSPSPTVQESIDSVVELLREAGLAPERPRALLEGAAPESSPFTRLRPLMEHVRDTDDNGYFARNRELAFLANTLVAGCSVQSRQFTPREASDAAASICNLGLEHWPAASSQRTLPDAFLVDHDLVTVFELGWATLHHKVSMFVGRRLAETLTDLRCVDEDIQRGLNVLRRELVAQCDAGTPWRARNALEVIAMLDLPAWVSLLGLLDECPVLPLALKATLTRQIGAVNPTAFEFIATTNQINEIQTFTKTLLDVLIG